MLFPFVFKLWRYHDLPAAGDIPGVVRKDPPQAVDPIASSFVDRGRYRGDLHRLWEERYRALAGLSPRSDETAGFRKILAVDDETDESAEALEAAHFLASRWSLPAVESPVARSAEEIIRLAGREGAGLIVIAEAMRTPEERVRKGSLAEALVKEADRPVLVVRRGSFGRGIRKILLPVDATPESLTSLAEALRWTRLFSSELLVLHVEEEGRVSAGKETEHKAFLKILDEGKWGSARHETFRGQGTVGAAILECAREQDADLIVMGTHRAVVEGEMLPQSHTLEVLRGATAPMLALHPYV